MCGICGVWGGKKTVERVRLMLTGLAHRGTDGTGVWSEHDLALGHNRLAIVDLSPAGAQPKTSQDERLVSVVNGEIYNYPILRQDLEAKGHRFKSNCDSEVVLPLYLEYGLDGLRKLNGMFAFALWDRDAKRLILVRDRVGIKPLYYYRGANGEFAFASEIKGLFACFNSRRWDIDPEGLSQYLTYQNQFGPTTLFKNVKRLEPGSYLDVTCEGIRHERYWEPVVSETFNGHSFRDVVSNFRTTFESSVQRHLMSDVPVSAYLSAGFDSASVASQANELLGHPPKVFTGRFPQGGWYNEFDGAKLVAAKMQAEHVAVDISPDLAMETLDDMVLSLDAPQMGMGALPQYLVAKAAAQYGKVILTGHGGDELFSGYPVFKFAAFASAFRGRSSGIVSLLSSVRHSEIPHLAYFTLNSLRPGSFNSVFPVLFSSTRQSQVLKKDIYQEIKKENPSKKFEMLRQTSSSLYELTLRSYLELYLPGLLTIEDKISMAHTLESRTPLLDNEMVELSLSFSSAVKLHDGILKAVLKEGVRNLLPSEIYQMPKRGFPTPLGTWLRGPLSDWAIGRIEAEQSALRRLFNDEFLRGCVTRFQRGLGGWYRPFDELGSHRMWMLLSLESWLRQTEEKYNIQLNFN